MCTLVGLVLCYVYMYSGRLRVMISIGCAADLFFRTCVDTRTAGGVGYLTNTCLHTCLEGKCSSGRYWGTPRKRLQPVWPHHSYKLLQHLTSENKATAGQTHSVSLQAKQSQTLLYYANIPATSQEAPR